MESHERGLSHKAAALQMFREYSPRKAGNNACALVEGALSVTSAKYANVTVDTTHLDSI